MNPLTPQQRYYRKNRLTENARSADYNRKHREERTAYAKTRRSQSGIKEWANTLRRLRKHDISLEILEAMRVAQDGKCAVCFRVLEGLGDTKECIDHDHATGKVRQLLCARCNIVLGKVNDDPAVLRLLATYLEDHRG